MGLGPFSTKTTKLDNDYLSGGGGVALTLLSASELCHAEWVFLDYFQFLYITDVLYQFCYIQGSVKCHICIVKGVGVRGGGGGVERSETLGLDARTVF